MPNCKEEQKRRAVDMIKQRGVSVTRAMRKSICADTPE